MDQEQKINILRDVIKIKSINNHEKEVALYYQSLLSKHGIESTIIEYEGNRANLIAEINGDTPGKTLVFNGHIHHLPLKLWRGKCTVVAQLI